jgi:hypothetical protein
MTAKGRTALKNLAANRMVSPDIREMEEYLTSRKGISCVQTTKGKRASGYSKYPLLW